MGGQSRLGRADQFCRLRRLRRIGLKTARGRSAHGRPAPVTDFSSGALAFRLGLALAVGRLDWERTGSRPFLLFTLPPTSATIQEVEFVEVAWILGSSVIPLPDFSARRRLARLTSHSPDKSQLAGDE